MIGDLSVGVVSGGSVPPAQIPRTAKLAEELGYDELWLVEDCFFTSGMAGATAALAATEKLTVGLGIVSAVIRHPALLAMEASTIEGLYPGRLQLGVGLGVIGWLKQMGIYPKSSLTAVRECVTSVRSLLAGEEVTLDGQVFTFDQIKLVHPTENPMPIHLGVMGPKMVELSGEIGDGLVVGMSAGAEYVRWARERMAVGAARANGAKRGNRVTCYVIFAVDEDGEKARQSVRDLVGFYLAIVGRSAYTEAYGISDEVERLIAEGGIEAVQKGLPDEWLTKLAVAGTPQECADQIQAFRDAGADCIVLHPEPMEDSDRIIRIAADQVLPRLK
jgi:5,10-methylenetetrahydromethanopterin reductase